jgi:hypothetical protein
MIISVFQGSRLCSGSARRPAAKIEAIFTFGRSARRFARAARSNGDSRLAAMPSAMSFSPRLRALAGHCANDSLVCQRTRSLKYRAAGSVSPSAAPVVTRLLSLGVRPRLARQLLSWDASAGVHSPERILIVSLVVSSTINRSAFVTTPSGIARTISFQTSTVGSGQSAGAGPIGAPPTGSPFRSL